MSAKKIRLGIAGLGMGLSHASSCFGAKNADLVAVADINSKAIEDRKDRLLKRFGEKNFKKLTSIPMYADYRRMIKEAEIDAVIIALPTGMHVEASKFALRNGLHVLCEKPPSINAREMVKVAELSREKGLKYMYVRQQRFDPVKQAVRKLINQGKLGEIYHSESKWMRTGGIPFRHGWGVNKDHGGGVLLDLGVHQIDDAWFLMGCPRPVEAFAAMHCSFSRLGDGQGLEMPYNADDGTMGMIRFENGASLSFTVTFAMNTAGPRNNLLEGEGKADWTELAVYGTHAGAEIHDRRLTLRKGKTTQVVVKEIKAKMPRGKNHLILQTEHFCDCIQTGKEVQNTPEQAVMLMQMLDAVKRSAETGKSVTMKQLVSV